MEPWLTGSFKDEHPILAALLYSFEHAQMDVARWTEGLTVEQLWRRSGEVAPVAFHILHIGGSVDRLMSYAAGGTLSESQMRELRAEQDQQDLSREELLGLMNEKLDAARQTLQQLDLRDLNSVRHIGRQRIAVPLGVLLVHISEHTQRHTGALIVTTKIVREAGASLDSQTKL